MVGIDVMLLEETKCSQFALSVGDTIYVSFNGLKIRSSLRNEPQYNRVHSWWWGIRLVSRYWEGKI